MFIQRIPNPIFLGFTILQREKFKKILIFARMNRYGWLMSNIMNTTGDWGYMVNQANEAPQGAARFNFDNLNMDQIKSQSSVWLSTFTVVGERSRGDESGKAGGGDGWVFGQSIDITLRTIQ